MNNITILNRDHRNHLGEGLCKYQNHLYWVDIMKNNIYKYDLLTGVYISQQVETSPSIFIPTSNPEIGMYSTQNSIKYINYNNGLSKDFYIGNDINKIIRTDIRYNDGKCDKYGNLYIGTMSILGKERQGALYKFTSSNSNNNSNNNSNTNATSNITKQLDNVSISNGMGWFNNNFYYIDTPTQKIQIYDINLNTKYDEINLSSYMGVPDGMTIVTPVCIIFGTF